MKQTYVILLLILIPFMLQPLFADELDDLGALADDSTTAPSESLSDPASRAPSQSQAPGSSRLSFNIGGYLKAMGYWNEERYSDELWNDYYANYASMGYDTPAEQKINGYNYIGTRLQLKIEAFMGDKARMFSAFNVGFNSAGSIHNPSSDASDSEAGDIRLVESYVEIYQGSTTWKAGAQLVTWGYMEGFEVPTDRVNARDYTYKSTEYEDSKLASTGVQLTQRFWDSYLDILFIPIARTNKGMEFREYFYPEADEPYEDKPNNGKWASRFSSTLGNLDFALSYVEGLDPEPDLVPSSVVATGIDPDTGEPVYTVMPTGKQYHRVQSPGMDLQYNFGDFLAKVSYVRYMTEDEEGDDLFIKNHWSKYVIGTEFTLFDNTVNLYAGQHIIEDFQDDALSMQTNFLLGQLRERTDFVSGHINASFLTGDALNLVLLAAGYWDEDGESVQTNAKATITYKVANGVEVIFSPSYMDLLDNVLVDYQFEVKYSF